MLGIVLLIPLGRYSSMLHCFHLAQSLFDYTEINKASFSSFPEKSKRLVKSETCPSTLSSHTFLIIGHWMCSATPCFEYVALFSLS